MYPSGNSYTGSWLHDKRHGHGTMKWVTKGQVYNGEWINDLPNGLGEHVWQQGTASLQASNHAMHVMFNRCVDTHVGYITSIARGALNARHSRIVDSDKVAQACAPDANSNKWYWNGQSPVLSNSSASGYSRDYGCNTRLTALRCMSGKAANTWYATHCVSGARHPAGTTACSRMVTATGRALSGIRMALDMRASGCMTGKMERVYMCLRMAACL